MNFPDLPHLLHLQKDLWKWPRGRAVLMVGAGFSLNATPLPGATSRFPTWRQLVRAMFNELHPPNINETNEDRDARDEKFNSASPMRIASEFEAALGREKLNALIREQNPDADFIPGFLHQLLMELPWADVFTTNYDTLLERSDVPGRNYQVVMRAEELPSSVAPRIIKLHGSLPSHTAFIISEEDYRTYPRQAAPFVNTVQQALLENAFVLVGFSGDDPNFLAWTGWIRDELGEHHAPIYLVGPLHLGHAERQLLNKRGVTPIDLAPLFEGIPSDKVHKKSIEWFLKCLAASKPPRPDRWPEFVETGVTVANDSPPIVGMAEKAPNEIRSLELITNEIAVQLVQRWQFERLHYPGWVILPHEKRMPLWIETQVWLEALFKLSQEWPVAERLLLHREINWRLETAMIPLFPYLIEPFEKAVNEAIPIFTQGNTPRLSKLLPGLVGCDADIISAWVEIAFGLLRESRETYNEQRWKTIKAELDKIVPVHPEFDDQNKYEEALWAIWNMKRLDAKNFISNWHPSSTSPLASLRKAGLLAELDELGEASTLLRSALANVRKALRIHGQNISLLSLEGWVTYLIYGVEQALSFVNRTPVREEFWDRWQELKAWDCSPWVQTEYFEQELEKNPPEIEPMEKEKKGFDPGEYSVCVSCNDVYRPFLPAFACLRFYEQAGIPLRLQRVSLMGKALLSACIWIAPFIKFWSPAILLRAGNADGLANNSPFMTRSGIALLPAEIAQRLHSWFLNILEKELDATNATSSLDSAQESILRNLPAVMSRLSTRISEADLQRSFTIALKLHNLPAVRIHLSLHNVCESWFKRIFFAAEPELLLEWLPTLIRSSLFDHAHLQEWQESDFQWPDPMNHFPSARVAKILPSRADVTAKVEEAVSWLLNRASSESGIVWRRAMLRLLNLSSWNMLQPAQASRARALAWSKLGQHGLPNLINLRALAHVLALDRPNEPDGKAAIKRYILSLQIQSATKEDNGQRVLAPTLARQPRFFDEVSVASKKQISFHGEPLAGIEWTAEEADTLFDRAYGWWETDKAAVQTEEQRKSLFNTNEVLIRARCLNAFISLAVLPYVNWQDSSKWFRLFKWLNELRSVGVYMDATFPFILQKQPERADEFGSQILEDLISDSGEAVVAAAEATRNWAHLAKTGKVQLIRADVVDAFVKRVAFRRTERIEYCLNVFSHLLNEIPDLFTVSQVELLSGSLGPWNKSTILTTLAYTVDGFQPARRPLLRARIGELAGALKRWYLKNRQNEPIPKEIGEWENICKSDVLPEIRRSFNEWDETCR